MRHYATAPRRHQLGPLFESMRRHCQPFTLHVLAYDWDEEAEEWGDEDGMVKITPYARLLRAHPELAVLPGRPRTPTDEVCTARWAFYEDLVGAVGAVTGIDGDVAFFSSPEAVYQEVGQAEVAVSPHRFVPAGSELPGVKADTHARYGAYNGGWVYLASREAAAFMRRSTAAWCYSEVRDVAGRPWFGDQGALETMAEAFDAHVVRHPGLNLGPWNVHRHRLEESDDRLVMLDRRFPLISYHFSSLRLVPGTATPAQLADPPYEVERHPDHGLVYDRYLRDLSRWPAPA